MNHFIGLDVSLKMTNICVIDEHGKLVMQSVAKSNPESIFEAIKRVGKLEIKK